MRHRKTYFALILFILCLMLLYFTTQYVDLPSTELIKNYKLYTLKPVIIPSIIVYSKKRLADVSKKCSQRYQPEKVSVLWDNKWQKLNNNSYLFLYSIHIDKRLADNNYLRAVAMSKGMFTQKIFCRIWFQNKSSLVAAVDSQELWVPKWDFAKPHEFYRPLLLSCPFPKSSLPNAASIIAQPCKKPRNVFWLNQTDSQTSPRKDFAICVKPLDFTEDKTHRLLEWLELQFILGADDITAYKYHLPPKMFEVLEAYRKSGKVTIKEHTLPGESPNDPLERRALLKSNVWQKRRHEMVIYNDCFYRHLNTHKYVVNLDLDEVIMPVVDTDWKSLLEHMSLLNPKTLESAAISAPNVYFFDSFGVESNDSVPEYFHMLRHLYRSANFTPLGFAQKSFCSTNYTLSVTNHYALKALYPNIRISAAGGRDLVQMHHYRSSCPPKMEVECEENFMKFRVKDPVILRFKDRLIQNVGSRIKELNLTDLNT